MNQKQAKRLRQNMRDMGFDPSEAVYSRTQAPVYLPHATNDKGVLVYNTEGSISKKVNRGVPKRLVPCGRKLYQDMKQDF